MPGHFLRVELVLPAPFEANTLAGKPLLDRGGENFKILRRWLGSRVAEPEVGSDGSVRFYVHRDGTRLLDVPVQPINSADLAGVVEELRAALAAVQPASASERALKDALEAQLQHARNPTLAGFVFFKYRERDGSWRPLWCWGYQRREARPAGARVCQNLACDRLLFAQTAGSLNCYRCSTPATVPEPTPSPPAPRAPINYRRWGLAAAVVLLVALLGWLGYRYLPGLVTSGSEQLTASPEVWRGPVGGRVEFALTRTTPGREPHDVSRQTVAYAEDPRVLRLQPGSGAATALAPGSTVVHFFNGKLRTRTTVTVEKLPNPRQLVLEPERQELAVHATARLKAFAVYDDGNRVQLDAGVVEWAVPTPDRLFCHRGSLEGLRAGEAEVRARYRAGPQDPWREATARVEVVAVEFAALEPAVEPLPLVVGQPSELVVLARDTAGRTHDVLGSSALELALEPSPVAAVEEREVHGRHPGKAVLRARFQGLKAELPLEVVAGEDPVGELVVVPRELNLALDEVAGEPARAGVNVKLEWRTLADERFFLDSGGLDSIRI